MSMVKILLVWVTLEQKSADEVHAKAERRNGDSLIEVDRQW